MTQKLLLILALLSLIAVPVLGQGEVEEPPECPAFEGSSTDVRTGYYMGEGQGLARSGQAHAAITSYTCIIEVIDEDYLPAYVRRAILYTQVRDYEAALEDYTAIIQRDSTSVAAHNNRGIVYFLQTEYEEALADFNRALELDSEFVIGYNNRAVLHTLQGDFQAAMDDLDTAIEVSGIEEKVTVAENIQPGSDQELPEFTRAEVLSLALRGIVRSHQALDNYNDYITLNQGGDQRVVSAAGALDSRFTFEMRLDDGSWLMPANFEEEAS